MIPQELKDEILQQSAELDKQAKDIEETLRSESAVREANQRKKAKIWEMLPPDEGDEQDGFWL